MITVIYNQAILALLYFPNIAQFCTITKTKIIRLSLLHSVAELFSVQELVLK